MISEPLERHRILLEVDSAVLRGELAGQPFDYGLVEVVASEVGVTVGGLDLEHTVAELEYGYIESTATEVVDGDLHVLVLLVETVCKRCRGRLVDDTLHLETRDLAGLLGGLALRVGEVSGHRDDRLGHFLAQVVLGRLLHLLKDDRRNLLRRILASVDVYAGRVVVAAHYAVGHAGNLVAYLVVGLAHESLDREYGVLRIGDRLTLGGVADLALSAVGESDDRRSGAGALFIDNHGRLVAFHNGYA